MHSSQLKMNKALAIFLILAGLVAIARSADTAIAVSNDFGDLIFTPQIAKAIVGDNVCIPILFVSFQ